MIILLQMLRYDKLPYVTHVKMWMCMLQIGQDTKSSFYRSEEADFSWIDDEVECSCFKGALAKKENL
jgi:hypothetical protein